MIDTVLRKAIEARLASQGLDWLRLRHLELRASQKILFLEIDLDGEDQPVHATARYQVVDTGVLIASVETSRRWLTECALLALAKHGGHFPLPPGLAGTLARALL